MSLSSDHPSAVTTLCCPEQSDELISSTADSPISLLHHPPSDSNSISTLIHSETLHMPHPDYLHLCRLRPLQLTARQDSINWILKVLIESLQSISISSLINCSDESVTVYFRFMRIITSNQ